MLFFQIDNYNNPKYLAFKTKSEAKTYIESHPDSVGKQIQVTEDLENRDSKTGLYPNNGSYEVRILRNQKGQKVPTLVAVPPFAGTGKSFQDIFGTKTSSRGTIQNKILLAFWKARFKRTTEVLGYPCACESKFQSMDDLFDFILSQLNNHTPMDPANPDKYLPSDQYGHVTFKLGKHTYNFTSAKYADINSRSSGSSFCSDFRCVKLLDREATQQNHKNQKFVIVKASKVILDVIRTNRAYISEQATTYIAEEFQRRYESEKAKLLEGLELHIDDHFDYIYSSDHCNQDFGSCMCGKRQYTFYNDIMPASAAYLVDKNIEGPRNIVARCVLFHNVVRDDTPGKTFNYAERQYSGNEMYKHILITKLIEAGAIDLYKTVGAGCRDVSAILDVNGKRIGNTRISLTPKRKLKRGDVLSFQDTFVCYAPSTGKFYNYSPSEVYREMGHTNPRYEFED